jgi:hypothetical protein
MKRTQLLALATLAVAITAASCGHEPAANDPRVAVQFASTGLDAAPTRINGTEWEGGELIGIYMVEHGTNTIVQYVDNFMYKATTAGPVTTFSPEGPTIYYPVTTPEKVDFCAYCPRTVSTTSAYPVSVQNQTSQDNIDLLWVRAGAGYDKTRVDPVELAFTHQLAKLNLTVVAGEGVTSLAGLAVSIEGMYTSASFDLIGTNGITGESNVAPITPHDAGNNTYEAILLPVDPLEATHLITFTIGTDVYTWNLSGTGGISSSKLESGKKYDYTVTLNKHALNITGTINDWTPGDSGEGSAE